MRFLSQLFLVALCSAPALGESAWSIDKPLQKIPDRPVAGSLFGRPFQLGSATINKFSITLVSKAKTGLWPDGRMTIFLGTKEKKNVVVITPESEGKIPHVHMSFAKGGNRSGVLMFTEQYSMRLVFVERTAKSYKIKIHISLPDYKKSYLLGTFVAEVR